jgi:hypothetical protein
MSGPKGLTIKRSKTSLRKSKRLDFVIHNAGHMGFGPADALTGSFMVVGPPTAEMLRRSDSVMY